MKPRHLGDDIHELLDGRLRGDRAYTAMAHLGECAECARRFEELRRAREALNSSQAGIDMRFAQQLLDRRRIAEIAASESPDRARAARRRSKAPLIAAATVVVVMMVVVGAAWQAGAPDAVSLEFAAADANPATVAYVDTQEMRSGELLRSWIHPNFEASELVPVEASVVRARDGQLALVATLLAGMEPITVVQQHGHLDERLTAALPAAQVARAEAFVVASGDSSTVVWQTGDVVVALSCECSVATLESVAEEFPTAQDPSFVDRVADGLDTFADALGQ